MLNTIRKSALTVAALGAVGLGAAGISGAADNATSSIDSARDRGTARPRPAREALSSEVAAKVKAAALEKVPGATVIRVEGGGPYRTAYHAHIENSAGKRRVALVNASFEATAVQAERMRGGHRGRGHHGHGEGGRGAGETALNGETKEKVEAAVLAEYAGATILRTETNSDKTAPYESHIETSAGKELELLVSKDFEVVDAREHPSRP